MFPLPVVLLATVIGALLSTCTPQSAGDEKTETTAEVALWSEDASRVYVRPYGPTAPWNIPVAGLERHPESEKYVELLWYRASDRPGNFNIRTEDYTYPVYSTREATGSYGVETKWKSSNLDNMSIPWNPEWRPAPGTDAQVIVLDEERGREWNLFQVETPFRGVVRATHANLVPGDYRTRVVGYSPSRGVGIPYLAMLVRPQEIAQGRIDHALSMPIRNPSGQYFVPPATKLEHATGRPGIPEGMRFAIDVSDAEIERWASGLNVPPETRSAAKIVARALRDYGWFITDLSGSAGFQFESSVSASLEWNKVGLGTRRVGYRQYPQDLLDGLITKDRIYAVVDSDKY